MSSEITPQITPNIPLLRKTVEWVEEQAELPVEIREWNQSDWALNVDWQDQVNAMFGRWMTMDMREQLDSSGRYECGAAYCFAGKVVIDHMPEGWIPPKAFNFQTEAMRLLGLNFKQAEELFDAENDAPRIRMLAEHYAGEKL